MLLLTRCRVEAFPYTVPSFIREFYVLGLGSDVLCTDKHSETAGGRLGA
jgi:hypothetical protein